MISRCSWCQSSELLQKYHDEEWGIPIHDDIKHFEFLLMEVMQCGLNWTMMLKKRKIFSQCFDNFDYEKIALYDQCKVESIIDFPGMIKSERKIKAVVNNAKKFITVIHNYNSFDQYLWTYTQNKVIVYSNIKRDTTQNELSDIVSADLKKRGFKYLGSITVYAHLQACGIINDHEKNCFLYNRIILNNDVCFIE